MIEICLVTGNIKKLEEYQKTLEGFRIVPVKLDIPEIQGEPLEIVKLKAKEACRIIGKPCFVDDTSLSFNAWNGLPGPYIKHYIRKVKLEDIVRMLEGFTDQGAIAYAHIGYCEPDKEPVVFTGEVKGTIVSPRGKTDFGWDPIFQPDGYDRTYAEMESSIKNRISHRALASIAFRDYLLKRNA